MNEEEKPQITAEFIINKLKEKIQNKIEVSPDWFCDAAEKLNVLIGDETDKLADLQMKVAIDKVKFIDMDMSVSEAKTRTEALPIYRDMVRQKAKVAQIEEFIRINKIRSRLKDNEYRQ